MTCLCQYMTQHPGVTLYSTAPLLGELALHVCHTRPVSKQRVLPRTRCIQNTRITLTRKWLYCLIGSYISYCDISHNAQLSLWVGKKDFLRILVQFPHTDCILRIASASNLFCILYLNSFIQLHKTHFIHDSFSLSPSFPI